MASSDGPKFSALLPTLRGYYAYLKCGQEILKEVFLWKQKLQDIPNVEHYLLNDFGMINKVYRKEFNASTRDNFKSSGITKIDITALYRMHYTVNGFFKDTAQATWSDLEKLLNQIKNERNDIMHTLLMKDKLQDENELNAYLNSISDHVDAVIQAFHDEYRDYATEQQRMDLKNFVTQILDEARKQNNEDKVNVNIQHLGTGTINCPEDVAKDLFQQIFNVVGEQGSLSIQHHGSGDINMSHQTIHVTGGSPTIVI